MMRLMNSIVMGCAMAAAVSASGCMSTDASTDEAEREATPVAGPRSHGGTEIHLEDDCDFKTFGTAACNPNFNGFTTLASFNADLAAQGRVGFWAYVGGGANLAAGQTLTIDNKGGQLHTFTIVANFGGGRDAGINATGHFTTVAPECVAGANATNVDIPSLTGVNVSTGASGAIKPGTYKVQCCIHPWEHSSVVVH